MAPEDNPSGTGSIAELRSTVAQPDPRDPLEVLTVQQQGGKRHTDNEEGILMVYLHF